MNRAKMQASSSRLLEIGGSKQVPCPVEQVTDEFIQVLDEVRFKRIRQPLDDSDAFLAAQEPGNGCQKHTRIVKRATSRAGGSVANSKRAGMSRSRRGGFPCRVAGWRAMGLENLISLIIAAHSKEGWLL